MGKIISKDLFFDGFKYRFDDGKVEHFSPNVVLNGYKGDKGSRIEPAFLGGYKAIRRDGHVEKARI
ncbi:TPA: hypothetical protein U1151_000951 [Streptococcus suis]|nr:hypothetical protein [Streptococcus suis]HEM4952817.1 hypothetical protein [Streptococcus suis]